MRKMVGGSQRPMLWGPLLLILLVSLIAVTQAAQYTLTVTSLQLSTNCN